MVADPADFPDAGEEDRDEPDGPAIDVRDIMDALVAPASGMDAEAMVRARVIIDETVAPPDFELEIEIEPEEGGGLGGRPDFDGDDGLILGGDPDFDHPTRPKRFR
jgi:hypothetical protein